ncbi:MAG: hypothetical protein QXJ17_03100 [Nitrososphaeria archaeon]
MKILVRPLSAESLGVRSISTYVETPDLRVLIDAGAALAPRDGLMPHPLEYKALNKARERIKYYADKSEIIVVSHYHFDHFSPFFNTIDARWTWCDKRVASDIYSNKIVYLKNTESSINFSQKERGFMFKKLLSKVTNKIIEADNKAFYYGGTTIQFSEPLYHGEEGSKLGYVLATIIRSRGLTFMHASDVQGPMSERTFKYIQAEKPDILVIGGPPTYLKSVYERDINNAKENLNRLVETTKLVILDHHLLRDVRSLDFVRKLNTKAKTFRNKVQTFAEYRGKKNLLLESKRKELYMKKEPDEEFLKWINLPPQIQAVTLPPV